MWCNAIKGKGSFKLFLYTLVCVHNSRKDAVLQGLVGIGASSNFVKQPVAKQLGLDEQVVPCNKQMIFGNGVHDSIQSSVCPPIFIEGQESKVDALVIKGKGPNPVLSFDFPHHHDLIVDCKSWSKRFECYY